MTPLQVVIVSAFSLGAVCAGFLAVARIRLRTLKRRSAQPVEVPATGLSMSSAEHLWLHRSIDSRPLLAELRKESVDAPTALHTALLRASGLVSLHKPGPAQVAKVLSDTRAMREDVLTLMPEIERASTSTAPLIDAVLMEAIQAAPGAADDVIAAFVDLKIGDLLPVHDALADGVSSAGEHAAHAIANAHIPIITIATSAQRYWKAAQGGLDGRTALTEGAYEIGLRGGGVAAGATVGAHLFGTAFPIVGHIVGAGLGVLGGLIGSQVNAQRQARPLRDADAALRHRLAITGAELPDDAWQALDTRNWEALRQSQRALEAMSLELHDALNFWRRRIWPRFVDVAWAESLRRGNVEIAEERDRAEAFHSLVDRLKCDARGDAYLAAAAFAHPVVRATLGLESSDFELVATSLAAVVEQRQRLALLRS